MCYYLQRIRVSNARFVKILHRWHAHGTAQNRRVQVQELATHAARRVPPPLRFGAALVYVLIYHKPAGRDVGLAKSGFRPTAPRALHDRSCRLTPMGSCRGTNEELLPGQVLSRVDVSSAGRHGKISSRTTSFNSATKKQWLTR